MARLLIGLLATALGSACSAPLGGGEGGLDGGGMDGGLDGAQPDGAQLDGAQLDAARFDATGSDASRVDSGGPRDAGWDPDTSFLPPWPMRCADEPVAGFRQLDNGYWRPCNCFDGDPLRPVPTQNDEGIRGVPFDCDWPVGTIWSLDWLSIPPTQIDFLGCESIFDTVRLSGFIPEPFEDVFFSVGTLRPAEIARDRLCVPTECVFDTPGEPARCSDDCGPFRPDVTIWGGYATVYRVDRSACDDPVRDPPPASP